MCKEAGKDVDHLLTLPNQWDYGGICLGGLAPLRLFRQCQTLWKSWCSVGRVGGGADEGLETWFRLLSCGLFGERNKRVFVGVESSFSQLRSSLWSLIFLWCKQKVPVRLGGVCRESCFINSLLFGILIESLYTVSLSMFINENTNTYTW